MAGESTGRSRKVEDVRLRRRRSPKLVALGVLCIVIGALAAAALYSLNISTASVVAMTRDVTRGDRITASDLTIVEVPQASANGATSAEQMSQFVGATALSDLPSGSFPAQRHIGDRPLPEGHSLVGLRLEAGRIPISELAPGTHVRLVNVEDSSITTATIAASPELEPHSSHYLLDVVVASDAAPRLASLAALDQLSLIAEGDL